MTDTICPLCGKPNSPDRDECQYCQAPLKTAGFLPPAGDQDEFDQLLSLSGTADEGIGLPKQPESTSPFEDAVPDWLKETEAGFLEKSDGELEGPASEGISAQIDSLLSQPTSPDSENEPKIDDDWLASLLSEVGVGEPGQEIPQEITMEEEVVEAEAVESVPSIEEPAEEEPLIPVDGGEKPEWLTALEASSVYKLEGGIPPSEAGPTDASVMETGEAENQVQAEIPDWIGKTAPEETPSRPQEAEIPLSPAELPSWLEALRPADTTEPSGPVEDVSAADVVTAGPLIGLRGVISAHPAAIRARKPPTYSIKLRVTDEQRARVEMMEALLADEQKPKPLPSQPILTSRNIFRLVIAVALLVPIAWMIITGSQQIPPPQPGDLPGVIDFTQQVQLIPAGAPVLIAFDYEAGFSGEMNQAISTLINQLVIKGAFMTLVTTNPSGSALAESTIQNNTELSGTNSAYTNLGYIPGGTIGLLGLATSPKTILPYSLTEENVWANAPLDTISSVADFNAVIVITSDADTARAWIEQVGPSLQKVGRPLLFVTSSQAEPLILPYYEASPAQVQGMVSGLPGGLAYGRTVGNISQNGLWDAYSIGISASVLIILIGTIAGVVVKMPENDKKKEN
jgi:hypothetical protein